VLNPNAEMEMKTAIVAMLLVASVSTASAQYWNTEESDRAQRDYERRQAEAESNLALQKSLRDSAGSVRDLTGKSDSGARLRLERECTRALERGVEGDVRRSYGCRD
jgi:hypothetical protein